MSSIRPLRDRVDAPVTVGLPASGQGIVWRSATMEDAPAILECELEIGEVDHPQYRLTLEDVQEHFVHSWVDHERDTLLAQDESGNVIAWGFVTIIPGQETAIRALMFGGVRPSHRARSIGRRILAWQEARGLQLLAQSDATVPGVFVAWADEPNTSFVRLAQRHGFEVARHFLQLQRRLDQPIASHPLAGYEIVPFDLSRSEQVRRARNDSFRDHWGSQPTPEEVWEIAIRRSSKRHDLSFLALAPDGEVAGFVMSEVNPGDFEGQGFSHGYINLVGTRREHRGRGIARALLTHTLEAYRADGLEGAVLDVDAESPTGATALYEQVGFTVSDRSMELNKQF